MDRVIPDAPLVVAPRDCSGVCFPAPPGSTSDRLRWVVGGLRAAGAMRRLAASVGDDAVPEPALRASADALRKLSPMARARLFESALAGLDVPLREAGSDRCPNHVDGISPVRLVRHLIGHPDSPTVTLVFGKRAFEPAGLYLPHLHVCVQHGGNAPVAFVQGEGRTRIVWSDGQSATFVCGESAPQDIRHPRLTALATVSGIPILNGIPEAVGAASHFTPLDPARTAPLIAPLAAGVGLLGLVWPTAYAAVLRDVSALVLLETRDHARSHSPADMPGAVFMTVDEPARTGDLLCHEASHVRMNRLRLFDRVAQARDPAAEAAGFHSPWRRDLRPLRGLIDGVHAFLNVCHYHARLAGLCPQEYGRSGIYARQKRNVLAALDLVRSHALPTALGRLLIDEFEREAARL